MFDALTATQLAMDADQLKLQSISQNIANMNTPGFKKQTMEHITFDEHMRAQINNVAQQLEQSPIATQGTFNQTRNPNDLAISGEGYFQVQGKQEVLYTRRGDFQVNKEGELATATGQVLLGNGGLVRVGNNAFTINAEGALLIDHQKVDQINVVQFNDPVQLHYVGNGLYQSDESPTPATAKTRLLQGFIEQSNVRSADEMMEIIKTSRHFEANQRVMRSADNLLTTAINQLGEGNV